MFGERYTWREINKNRISGGRSPVRISERRLRRFQRVVTSDISRSTSSRWTDKTTFYSEHLKTKGEQNVSKILAYQQIVYFLVCFAVFFRMQYFNMNASYKKYCRFRELFQINYPGEKSRKFRNSAGSAGVENPREIGVARAATAYSATARSTVFTWREFQLFKALIYHRRSRTRASKRFPLSRRQYFTRPRRCGGGRFRVGVPVRGDGGSHTV